ncbi:MAG: sigma-70 family RNA polymerase sigma factor [Planctomycetes bacterium]|nr:sigma-70 family RNA polymerase sigma factor [Planctomycetota bacterium]
MMTIARPLTLEALLTETAWLRALCRQLVRDADRAEDLFQDTVLASLADAGRVRGALRPWLAGIARHLVANRSRAEQRRRRREAHAARSAEAPSTAETVARIAVQQGVIQAVRELPEAQRDAVLLRYFEDLPPRAIAARLGVPVDTVKTRLKRGLAALRERLDCEHGGRAGWVAALVPLVMPSPVAPVASGGVRLAVAGLVVALTAAATWLAWPDRAAPAPRAEERSAAIGTTGAPAERAASSTGARAELAPPAMPAAAEAAVAAFEVEVVDAATGAPVPDAVVRFARTDAGAPPRPEQRELEAAVERREITYADFLVAVTAMTRADARGIARIPRPADAGAAFTLTATAGERDGRCGVQVDELRGERPRIELRSRPVVVVQVLDAEGAPAGGVPVDYLLGPNVYLHGETPASGAPLHMSIPFAEPAWLEYGSVAIALPLGSPVAAPAPATQHGAPPIELRLPPTGALMIDVVDPQGRPLAAGELFLERPADEPGAPSGERVARARVVDGAARFVRVGVGGSWRVAVRADGYCETWTGVAESPRRPGLTEHATVRAPGDVPRIAVRVVDADGAPLAGQPVVARLQIAGGRADDQRAVLDGDGTLCLRRPPGTADVELTLVVDAPPGATDDARLGARLQLPAAAEGVPLQAFEAWARPLPLFVAGRVTDGSGRPVASARVRITSRAADGADAESDGPDALTSADGRFAIHGFDASPRFRIVVERDDRAPIVRDDVPIGSDRLELSWPASRAVVGRVACRGAEPEVECRLASRDAVGAEVEPAPIDADGSFRFAGVPVGSYTLAVVARRDGTVLHRFPVQVGAGDDTFVVPVVDLDTDPRIVRLRVRAPDGSWPAELWLQTEAGGSTSFSLRALDADGCVALVVTDADTTVSFELPGFDPVRLEALTRDREVRLVAR